MKLIIKIDKIFFCEWEQNTKLQFRYVRLTGAEWLSNSFQLRFHDTISQASGFNLL